MIIHFAAVLLGCCLDFCFGDPRWLYHPVCAMGVLIQYLEKKLRTLFPKGKKGEKAAGIWLVILVLLVSGAVALLVLMLAYGIHIYIGVAVESFICYQMMAWRSLRSESMKVYDGLAVGKLEEARLAVSMIVGRDTASLTDEGITKAAVETVAENTSDGVIAPLLSMILLGGLGVVLYKAVNTMDSMVGYKNERYLYFGRAAARLDDVCNYIPARISAVFMLAAGYILQLFDRPHGDGTAYYSGSRGRKIFLRDRYHHKSPNSAQTEAACAGILGIRLAGSAYYFGTLQEKPFIGDGTRPVEYEDIIRANNLMNWTYGLSLAAAVLLWGLCFWITYL